MIANITSTAQILKGSLPSVDSATLSPHFYCVEMAEPSKPFTKFDRKQTETWNHICLKELLCESEKLNNMEREDGFQISIEFHANFELLMPNCYRQDRSTVRDECFMLCHATCYGGINSLTQTIFFNLWIYQQVPTRGFFLPSS